MAEEEREWKSFRNSLDRRDRKEFDSMFADARLYIRRQAGKAAANNARAGVSPLQAAGPARRGEITVTWHGIVS
jgi:hypothetical protein